MCQSLEFGYQTATLSEREIELDSKGDVDITLTIPRAALTEPGTYSTTVIAISLNDIKVQSSVSVMLVVTGDPTGQRNPDPRIASLTPKIRTCLMDDTQLFFVGYSRCHGATEIPYGRPQHPTESTQRCLRRYAPFFYCAFSVFLLYFFSSLNSSK